MLSFFLVRPGFILQNGTCVCDPVAQIANYNLECNLEEQTVRRLGGSWVNATYANNGTYSGLIVHESCPYDYCTSDDSDIDLTDPMLNVTSTELGFFVERANQD